MERQSTGETRLWRKVLIFIVEGRPRLETPPKESYQVKGVINVTYPVLDEHGHAVAALTVPYIRRIGDNTTTAIVRQALKRASSQLSQGIGGISRERQKPDTQAR